MTQQITVDLCLGVSNGTSISDVEVFPNPFNNVITVQCGAATINGELKIYDLLGQEVFSSIITKEKTEIDMTKYPNGVYFVKIISSEGIVAKQIIKQ